MSKESELVTVKRVTAQDTVIIIDVQITSMSRYKHTLTVMCENSLDLKDNGKDEQ